MKAAFYILFGSLLTFATSLSLGGILVRALSLKLRRTEEWLLAFVTGSALLSGVVFLLCTTRLARKGVFLAVGLVSIASAIRMGVHRPQGDPLPPIARRWKWVIGGVFGGFTILYFFNAMAPEMSPDGAAYHLVFPGYYYRAHGFVRIPWNMYANITQGVEMLFLFAYAFGRHSAAALVHFSFLATLPWLMISYGRRVGIASAGIAGALFFFVSPVIGIDGSVAYVDVALTSVLFALFYFLQIWDEQRDSRLLIPIGILAGFSFAIKYTAFLAVPYAIGFLAWKLWRARQPILKPLAAVAGLALVFILPWLVKNWMWMDNPVTPFANRIFRTPYIHISFEDEYKKIERIYSLTSYRQIPWELTINGNALGGLFGPLFLLAPLALLAARNRTGRQLLLAAAVFALPYLTNVGARFLIPCAPFLTIALGMALNWEWLLMALVLAHALLSWPDVLKRYASESAWHLTKVPIREALRTIPENVFLSQNFPPYLYDRAIDNFVPPGAKVYSFSQPGESYTTRPIFVKYLSAPSEVLGDIMWTAIYSDMQPSVLDDFHFVRRSVKKLRVTKTKDMQDAMWNISELRVYDQEKEIPRASQWRLKAKPNPWDVQLAFDNSPVTRWRSWEPGKPGMYLEIDFGGAQLVDAVRIETQPDWRDPDMKIEGMDESGRWATLTTQAVVSLHPITYNLRRAAIEELKARGFRYMLIGYDDIGSEDYQQHPKFWGISLVADVGYSRLYYIQ